MNDHAQEIRRSVTDPVRVCRALGLLDKAKRQAGGVIVRCPWHDDADPSCSVRRAADGTICAKCFSCGATGDVLALVAGRYGLDCRRHFRDTLLAAAELFGLHQIGEELRGGAEHAERPLPPMPEPLPERDYPPRGEVKAVWDAAVPVDQDERSNVALMLRGLRPGSELARSLRDGMQLPRWAFYQGRSWVLTGHRLVLPLFDAEGTMRSLRSWQTNTRAEGPKRLPPAGCKASGLVLANDSARAWLSEPGAPIRLVVAEGEPDHLSACQAFPGIAVIGVGSGSWSEAFAQRVPRGSEVSIHTHRDAAGNRYADEITKTLAGRARIKRGCAP